VIVFDFGGVLLDWNPYYLYRKLLDGDEAVGRFLEEVGFFEWNKLNDLGRPFARQTAELAEKFPQYAELIYAYDARFPEALSGAIEGTVALLLRLHEKGYPLYGLSNWSAEKFWSVRPQFPFFDCFRGIVLSGEVEINKPDARIFQILLERIGRPAGECLLIDDAPANIAAAQELGFRTIRFEDPRQLEGELKRLGLL
jgi:2-haloacid dehalogenase